MTKPTMTNHLLETKKIHDQIKNAIIQAMPIGKENARHATDISNEVGLDPGTTNESLRGYIRKMIAEGSPLCSCSKGFFIPQNAKEFQEYVESLWDSIEGIQTRIRDLLRAWNRTVDEIEF